MVCFLFDIEGNIFYSLHYIQVYYRVYDEESVGRLDNIF
jgi:hypothetical protein